MGKLPKCLLAVTLETMSAKIDAELPVTQATCLCFEEEALPRDQGLLLLKQAIGLAFAQRLSSPPFWFEQLMVSLWLYGSLSGALSANPFS